MHKLRFRLVQRLQIRLDLTAQSGKISHCLLIALILTPFTAKMTFEWYTLLLRALLLK